MTTAALVAREEGDGVTVLRLQRGKANALDVELLDAMVECLADAASPEAPAIVLTADGPIFSAGVDLRRVLAEDDGYLERFLPLLDRMLQALFWHPRPVVAAINGHAIAGGCVIASACDYRIMAEGEGTIGVPELRVQVPFPASAIEILRFAAARAHFQELVYFGRTYSAGEAYERGLLDEVVPPAEVLPRAVEAARRLQTIPPAGFWLTKQQLRWETWQRIQEATARTADEVAALWNAPATRASIRRYVAERLGGPDRGTGT